MDYRWGETNQLVNGLARQLAQKSGDAVGVLLDNSYRCICLLLLCNTLAAQFLFAFSPLSSFLALGIATVILSLGELIVFPTFSVAVDQITPDAVRGSYFGAANLYSLGSALAPLYGGLMLDHLGGRALFLGLVALCALIIVLQGSANALKRTQEEEVESS